jgi:hypothetical protein
MLQVPFWTDSVLDAPGQAPKVAQNWSDTILSIQLLEHKSYTSLLASTVKSCALHDQTRDAMVSQVSKLPSMI